MNKRQLLSLIILIISLLSSFQTQAQKQISAKLEQATIYFNGATLTHTASTTLKSGTQEVIINGLSPDIVLSSLKVKANGVLISATEFYNDYITPKEESAHLKKLTDSLNLYERQLQETKDELTVHQHLLKMLTNGTLNNMEKKENPVSVADINANMELYKSKAGNLQNSINQDNKKIEKLQKNVNRLKQQISQDELDSDVETGAVRLSVSIPKDVNTVFTVTYFTNESRWIPCYDINIPSMDKPIVLQAKAQVAQTTGLDWKNVKLTLSTAQPNRTAVAPVFKAWFLYFRTYRTSPGSSSALSNTITYEEPASNSVRGNRSDGEATVIDGIRVGDKQSMSDYVNVNEQEFMVNYDIDIPYDIPGNGKFQLIDLNNYNIKADFKYYSAPKLSDATYIVATLSDFEKYNLLPGEANVTFNDTYVGKTKLRPNDTENQITLTLTTEPRVTVKREKQRDFCSTKHVGNSTTETRSYLLTVRNNLTRSAKLTLKEQYPISNDKDIEVKVTEVKPAATYDKTETGVLTWDMELNAGETRTFVVTYSVKYPKDRVLAW
jgi:uncharacterized protein (TIGR02231 family)